MFIGLRNGTLHVTDVANALELSDVADAISVSEGDDAVATATGVVDAVVAADTCSSEDSSIVAGTGGESGGVDDKKWDPVLLKVICSFTASSAGNFGESLSLSEILTSATDCKFGAEKLFVNLAGVA